MNNLLQSLSAQRLRVHVHDTDLKRLLAAVKQDRGHDTKLQDAFYDSLEGIINDLRAVTIDNHDAEAFLKPVHRVDYPDYYEIIKEPMDLQTMLRKVKQKAYKSKNEFADDLELIWSNCYTYNTGENHPLRLCAKRLREKANRLLRNITDRRDRLDPPVPSPSPHPSAGDPRPGALLNGHTRKHSASASGSPAPRLGLVIKKHPTRTSGGAGAFTPQRSETPPARREREQQNFADSPAFVRDPARMADFAALDQALARLTVNADDGDETQVEKERRERELLADVVDPEKVAGPSRLSVTERLRQIVQGDDGGLGGSPLLTLSASASASRLGSPFPPFDFAHAGDLGAKRKMLLSAGASANGDERPRKRARSRLSSSTSSPSPPAADDDHQRRSGEPKRESDMDEELLGLWWAAARSTSFMANALPGLPCASYTPAAPVLPSPKHKRKKKKRPPAPTTAAQGEGSGAATKVEVEEVRPPRTLLGHVNRNIRTLRQIRRTHGKLAALVAANAAEDGQGGAGGGGGPGGTGGEQQQQQQQAPSIAAALMAVVETVPDVKVDVDDRPWRLAGTGAELSEREANEGLRWMGEKVLEHSGFQSTSKAALDVLTGVAVEFFSNVGRTLRFLCDKYSTQMTSEEIVLHTLFESGITHVRDLERYISDDVVRYGTRLADLEKKLLNTYNDISTETAMDDENFFGEEDEEEEGELLMGNFADALGDDFLGLRELGIASELGLSSLTIPRKLLKSRNRNRNAISKPSEPPPPYPPPPPFAELDSAHVDNQIGLLRNFYIKRFNAQAARNGPQQPPPFITPAPPAPPPPSQMDALELELAREMGMGMDMDMGMSMNTEPSLPSSHVLSQSQNQSQSQQQQQADPVRNPSAPLMKLPDDVPAAAQTKTGPLGQVVRPAASAAQKKQQKLLERQMLRQQQEQRESAGGGVKEEGAALGSAGGIAQLDGAVYTIVQQQQTFQEL